MAALSFPVSPTDGQIYPPGKGIPGKMQWKYVASSETWEIVTSGVSLGDQEAFNSYSFPILDGEDKASLSTDGEGNLSWEPKGHPTLVNLELSEPFDGVEVTFDLVESQSQELYDPNPNSNITVFVGGVPQTYGVSYTVTGSSITFSEAPPIGANFFGFGITQTQLG